MQRTPPALMAIAAATVLRDMDRSLLMAHRTLERVGALQGTNSEEYHDQHARCEELVHHRADFESYMAIGHGGIEGDMLEIYDIVDRTTNTPPDVKIVL